MEKTRLSLVDDLKVFKESHSRQDEEQAQDLTSMITTSIHKIEITNKSVVQPSNEVQPPPVPFLKRLRKEKDEAQQKKFLENLKQLHINLPFIEALAKMSKYAKFLKGLLTNKVRLEEACKTIMNKRCSAVLLNKLPSKEKDPGSFTIPCNIGQLHIDNALADLGASISLMPYMMYKKLGLGEPNATRMSLELADSSNDKNGSDSKNSIRHIDSINTSYPVTQGTLNGDNVKCEHMYSASANEIDEKKPELKNLPQHLAYAYLHGDKSFPIIISSELSENEKTSLLQVFERRKGAITWKMSDIKGIRFFQIPIAPKDQEKTTFTCPYGTFAYRRMPFGLCNALATFQRCMIAIFQDMVEDFMEVFMDDFLVFGNSFNCCLANLDRMLARCEETNLMLNWEKCHFMIKEGIVLGHKIFGAGIEVDRAKINVIAKLPYP
ncbi:reverse transcriptase domain-containing protein, partial [Tanacetum coccineum]